MKSLKNKFREKFSDKELSKEQLSVLLDMQSIVKRPYKSNFWKRVAIGSCLALMVTLVSFLSFINQGVSLHEKIAHEVANQHIKLKPLEVSSGDFSTVQDYFKKLDFRPVATEALQGQLIGGRYCSLQGEPAAQFRFVDSSGNQQTLYQAEYTSELAEGLSDATYEQEVYAKGIAVSIWVDKGIVFALTK